MRWWSCLIEEWIKIIGGLCWNNRFHFCSLKKPKHRGKWDFSFILKILRMQIWPLRRSNYITDANAVQKKTLNVTYASLIYIFNILTELVKTQLGQPKLIKKKLMFPLMRWVEDVLITHTQQSSIKFLFSQNTAGSFRFVLTWIVGLPLSSETNVHCSIGSSGTTTSSHHNTPTCRHFWQLLRGSWG